MKRLLIQITGVCVCVCMLMLAGCSKGPDRDIEYKLYVTHPSLEMTVGDEVLVTASPTDHSFTWETTNPDVATVSAGLVRATGDGVCYINVTSSGGLSRAIPVDVVKKSEE